MNDRQRKRVYRLIDLAFWAIWLAFPAMIALVVQDVRQSSEHLTALYPELAGCIAQLPSVEGFSTAGRALYWCLLAVEFAFYAVLLGLAHQVIHRCAVGRVLVEEMIGTLRTIGMIIAAWPLVDIVASNGVMFLLVRTGDLPGLLPNYVPDLPVLGVGLLLLAIAAAMGQAVALRQDADLTI